MPNTKTVFSWSSKVTNSTGWMPCYVKDLMRMQKQAEEKILIIREYREAKRDELIDKDGNLVGEAFKAYKEYISRWKKALPCITWMGASRTGRRVAEDMDASGYVLGDFDGLADPETVYAHIRGHEKKLGIPFASKSASGYGLQVVAKIPDGLDIISAGYWLADVVGENHDPACTDISRASFMVSSDQVLYADYDVLNGDAEMTAAQLTDEEVAKYRRLAETHANQAHTGVTATPKEMPAMDETTKYPTMYCGAIPYHSICEAWFGPDDLKDGNRNNATFDFALQLRSICDNKPEWVWQVLCQHGCGGLSPLEIWSVCQSACKRPYNGRSKRMQDILSRLLEGKGKTLIDILFEGLPEMPKKLPGLMKLLVSRAPEIYHPAIALCSFSALAALPRDLQLEDWVNIIHRPTIMTIVVGPTGSGKNCVVAPCEHIIQWMRERDAPARAAVEDWRNDKADEKSTAPIQYIHLDASGARFSELMRNADAVGLSLYTITQELSNFLVLKNAAGGTWCHDLFKLSFDDALHGQERSSREAVSAEYHVHMCFCGAATPSTAQQFFGQHLIDGPISRIWFPAIPPQPIGSPRPVFKRYDEDFDSELKVYVDRITEATGVLDTKKINSFLRQLEAEVKQEAIARQDAVYDNLTHRYLVIGFYVACLLYIADGYRWSKPIEDFARWAVFYSLETTMIYFGDLIRRAESQVVYSQRPKAASNDLISLLPETFTLDDLIELYRVQNGEASKKDLEKKARALIRQWKFREKIMPTNKSEYMVILKQK